MKEPTVPTAELLRRVAQLKALSREKRGQLPIPTDPIPATTRSTVSECHDDNDTSDHDPVLF